MTTNTYQLIFKELLNCVTRDDILTDVSIKFKEWERDAERVADCYSLLSYYNLLPDMYVPKSYKSSEEAENFKNCGNKAFIQKDDYMALYYYTRAITCAPTDCKLMSLAFANRSAVTYSLGDYSDSVNDINRALSGNYPDHLKYKLFERKGKCWLKLQNFSEAEISFEAALEFLPLSKLDSCKVSELICQVKVLLEECRVKCTSKNTLKPEEEFFQLTHGPNEQIQSASCAVAVEYSQSMGRYLMATMDINPGDILAIEKPYSCLTLPSSYFSHCFYCQKRCHSMIPCLECTMACYCDEVCRENSWNESHSIECRIIKPLLQLNCGKMEMLSLRILMIATQKGRLLGSLASSIPELEFTSDPKIKGFSGDIYLSDSYKSIHNLEGNTDLRDVSYLFSRSVMTCCILHILNIHTTFFKISSKEVDPNSIRSLLDLEEKCGLNWERIFAGGLILKYLQSMASNAHEISEMRHIPMPNGSRVASSEIGSAAYPLLSLINHSCDPNVVRHSHSGSTVILTAIQAIKKGEQIFDNYGFHHATHSKEERCSHLKSQYHFTCQCLACIENWPLYGSLPEKNPTYLHPNPDILNKLAKSSEKFKEILYTLTQEKYREADPENLIQWLNFLCCHLKLLQENIKRPWQEFSACQEAIKQCLSFLANHYVYKSSPQTLTEFTDCDTSVSPF